MRDIVPPGNIYAYTDSPIYSRTDGYLEKWYFDIGSHVRKGQLLATVSTPEIDQQLLQSRVDLTTSQTSAHIASLTADRYRDLLKDDAVSKQDTENFASQARRPVQLSTQRRRTSSGWRSFSHSRRSTHHLMESSPLEM